MFVVNWLAALTAKMKIALMALACLLVVALVVGAPSGPLPQRFIPRYPPLIPRVPPALPRDPPNKPYQP